ncbi:MAG TPA: hypothetical protein VGY56_21055 [Verrucomicrobiae bacterium]|nr:hypothetical protein [Verrucomicrobiae bacterium]
MKPQPTGPSFLDTFYFVQWGIRFPASTIMTITRPDMGYRLVNPLVLVATFGLFGAVTILATPGNEAARPTDLLFFLAVGFASGIAQRIRRCFDYDRGVTRHSYYIGTSFLEFRWLPHAIRRHRRVGRLIEPVIFAGIGIALFPYSRALGAWLVFAAMCLRGYEDQAFRRQRNIDLDMIDSLVASEQQARVLEEYEQTMNTPHPQADAAVPTGLGDDIKEHIKQRKNTP